VRYWEIHSDIFSIVKISIAWLLVFIQFFAWLYMLAWRYDFYLLVFKTIFYSLAALVRKILFSPLEDKKSYLHAAVWYPLYIMIYRILYLGPANFDDFSIDHWNYLPSKGFPCIKSVCKFSKPHLNSASVLIYVAIVLNNKASHITGTWGRGLFLNNVI
jgi:hypothetical protein